MEGIHPREIDLGLSRISEVAKRLNINPAKHKVITVAGTNGKGSCVATLERILVDSGCTVGTYTSPHIRCYNERIKLNGANASDQVICDAFAEIDQARQEITLTYFEYGTLAAMLIFQQLNIQYWVLEVGLGGRLDAVNIIDPDIAVITSIDIDHTDWLGDTRELIAIEKAGILRKGIPVVCAERDPPVTLHSELEKYQAKSYWINSDFGYSGSDDVINAYVKSVAGDRLAFNSLPYPKLPQDSVLAALQVLNLLELAPTESYLRSMLENFQLSGRFEQWDQNGQTFIFDVAHNAAAGSKLEKTYRHRVGQKCIAVLAMMSDKKHDASLLPILPWVDHWVVTQIDEMPRTAKKEDLNAVLTSLDVDSERISETDNVGLAVSKAMSLASTNTPILIFGSFYTVAAAQEFLSANDNLETRGL